MSSSAISDVVLRKLSEIEDILKRGTIPEQDVFCVIPPYYKRWAAYGYVLTQENIKTKKMLRELGISENTYYSKKGCWGDIRSLLRERQKVEARDFRGDVYNDKENEFDD